MVEQHWTLMLAFPKGKRGSWPTGHLQPFPLPGATTAPIATCNNELYLLPLAVLPGLCYKSSVARLATAGRLHTFARPRSRLVFCLAIVGKISSHSRVSCYHLVLYCDTYCSFPR